MPIVGLQRMGLGLGLMALLILPNLGWAQFRSGVKEQVYSVGAAQNAGETILFIIDASNSMNDRVRGETKMAHAKRVVQDTISQLPPNVSVGLRVYGQQPVQMPRFGFGFQAMRQTLSRSCSASELVVPIGRGNHSQINTAIQGIQAAGMTPITYSLQQAIFNDFTGFDGKKTIILVSDGEETCAANPCDFAVEAVRRGVDVKINTIGFGTNSRVADQQLKCVALATKAKFYSANDAGSLAKSLQDATSVFTSVEAKIVPEN